MTWPTTAYAYNGGVAIAYQAVGSAGPDLLFAPGSFTHLEHQWEEPRVERFLSRLASFSRLVVMDPRGLGLSDRVTTAPTMDERVGDLLAVLDAAGSSRAVLLANADTGPPAIAAAVGHPDRVAGLVLVGTYATAMWSEDYPLGWTQEDFEEFRARVRERWGSVGEFDNAAPSAAGDEAFRQWEATLLRVGASPSAAILLGEMTRATDVRDLLPRVAVPTLVMHRAGDRVNTIGHGRYLAEHIPGAHWVELPGDDFLIWAGDMDAIADEVEEFLTGSRSGAEPTRVVATVMFTDVVGSTERARELGDRAWAGLLETHHQRVRAQLRRFGGREIDTAGDGFMASFTSPTSAIRCARAAVEAVAEIGVDIRVGLHTGECEVVGDKLRGIAVHLGARVAALAGAGEILVSQTVRDLVAGGGISFADRGTHELKGMPGEWRLFAVE
ncbi:MAG TPA: adenylate/guanylate cyclase domain-containing protein [Actinomycetota bacterium]